jgi:hypothetical protein
VESVLFSISLPACGSVYYKRDLEIGTETVNIAAGEGACEDTGGSTGQLCIGPDVAQKWWYGKRSRLLVPRGPCKYKHHCEMLLLGLVLLTL